jgi:2,3,4,5-tetrahydropyridine-2,6-dicarboxylate N-succinyltransferase
MSSPPFDPRPPAPGTLLRERIDALTSDAGRAFTSGDRGLFADFRRALARGEVRAAERDAGGTWVANPWVKRGILLGFRLGELVEMAEGAGGQRYFDKDSYPVRPLAIEDGVRVVPGGSSIRDGSYVAPGVVCMPPSYVNVGAYVDVGTMIDSHALVGSCAQIGKRVHLSAAAQIGGVLEPANALPVIIEDDAFVGGGCGVYEGTVVRERAVLAPGTILSGSTPVYDLPRERVYRREPGSALEIPAGAVVVPGSRAVESSFGLRWGLSTYAAVIVKYRDEKTDRAAQLEDALR